MVACMTAADFDAWARRQTAEVEAALERWVPVDAPAGLAWDTAGLLVVKYGFVTYGLVARTGALRWSHSSGSPVLAVLGSARLPHVLVQAEIETFALEEDGDVRWRVGHSDVVSIPFSTANFPSRFQGPKASCR